MNNWKKKIEKTHQVATYCQVAPIESNFPQIANISSG